MGMYTELILGASLKKETPACIIDTLRFCVGDIEECPKETEKLVNENNFRYVLCCESYYFGVSQSINRMRFDEISGCWEIIARASCKNYGGYIEEFLEWLKPWITQGSGERNFYAITIYEEASEPTIHYLN